MNRIITLSFLFVLPLIVVAQKKTFTFNQIFKGQAPAIANPLPEIGGWIDDNNYIEVREDDKGVATSFSVNVVTGKAVPYSHAKADVDVPEFKDALNTTLSPDGKYAAYTRNNNLYITELASKKETALTSDGSETILNGYASWIYYEEILGRASNYKAFWWSPDSKSIAFMKFDQKDVPVFPIYYADGQHGFIETTRYPKAGDKNPEVKLAITSIADNKTVWLDFDEKRDQYFGPPEWTPKNDFLVQWMNRHQDSLIVFKINKADGSKTPLYTEHQDTWISLDEEARFHFLSTGMIIKSDKDGWENLYLFDENGKERSKVTKGNFWGTAILKVDEKKKLVYFTARQTNAARFDVYKATFDGKKITRLSGGNYGYDMVSISPNAKYFAAVYSNVSTAPVMALFDNTGKKVREIVNTKSPAMDAYAVPVTKWITVKSSDGKFDLPMTVTYPVNFDSTKKYPVWISVYGGPNAGTVYDRWKPVGGLTQWWAQEGVVQVAMDNRSSGHFGKAGINYIFKQMGKWELEDYMTCAKWLKSQAWVDASKVGITGGSFGGYVTCMALTYGADVFTHGLSNYPVTDWQLYDTHYTERFMRTPAENPEGYKNTSVLTYVKKFKGVFRLVHGSTDDNVHMQNSIQLVDALQDLDKSFELMIYPNQRHGVRGTKARHNLKETCRFIYKNMLGKDLPKEFDNF